MSPSRHRARRASALALVLLALALVRAPRAATATGVPRSHVLDVGRDERLLVVAPHPDDEVLGAGGLVQRVLARGGTVDVLLVTAGDGYPDAVRGATGRTDPAPSDYVAYGARRIAETRAALDALGGRGRRMRLMVLGYPDGVLAGLRDAHWSAAAPTRSPTTGAADPPYDGLVADDAAPYAGEALLEAMTRVARLVRPTIVALPDPLDVHADHATTGWFTLAALADARSDARVVAYLVHWPAWPPGWDGAAIERGGSGSGLDLPVDLPARGGRVALALSPTERNVKHKALALHATQQRQMATYLAAFVRPREPYTLLPADAVERARAGLRAAPAAR